MEDGGGWRREIPRSLRRISEHDSGFRRKTSGSADHYPYREPISRSDSCCSGCMLQAEVQLTLGKVPPSAAWVE